MKTNWRQLFVFGLIVFSNCWAYEIEYLKSPDGIACQLLSMPETDKIVGSFA
ncbi:MAG: hypothetical protein V3U76_11020 [Granulosicoccus sp.]